MQLAHLIQNEIDNYINNNVTISRGNRFSQWKLVNRIMLYQNQVYPTGKLDTQANYKYWYDITGPRVDTEVKNIDFDTKDIIVTSDARKDAVPIFVINASNRKYMRESGEADRLNDAIEIFSAWGNIVWKKTKDGYEIVDLKNFFVINQTAETLKDTPAVERHMLTQSQIRSKQDVWKNIDELLEKTANKYFSPVEEVVEDPTQIPYYEVFERNGEISEAMLFDAMRETNPEFRDQGDPDKYILSKIVIGGLSKGAESGQIILFAQDISEMPYREAHRGKFKGRWFREGLIELLLDPQTRANEIGNQIARGLEWASKMLFQSKERLIAQNILTDLVSGDIIESQDFKQVEMRMQGLDQLIADWNRNLSTADAIANSREIAQGESLPSGTPFRLAALLNINTNKLFAFIRQRFGIGLQEVYEDWILPGLIKDLKQKDVLDLTGDSEYLIIFQNMVIESWYLRNLIAIGPHTREQAIGLKIQKLEELKQKKEASIKLTKKLFENVKPRVYVTITGEGINLASELESLRSFIQLETDPVRRTALIEMAMTKKGMDVASLPKTPPETLAPKPGVTRQSAPTEEEVAP